MTDTAWLILAIAGLVLANAVFVAAEFAIVGAPRTGIEHAASQGSRLAQRVAGIMRDPRRQDRYIATTQVGISLASVGLGMYGEHALAQRILPWTEPLGTAGWFTAHGVAVGVAIALLTYLHIVIGEMVPKALALQRAQRTALYVSPVIEALQVAIYPLVVGLSAVGNGLLRLVGIRRALVDTERYHTSEELQLIIQESQEGGLLRGESGTILRELFEFGDRTAAEVMVPRVRLVGVPVGATSDQLRELVRRTPHTRYPVFVRDLDDIAGSVHVKALLRHFVAGSPVTAENARPVPYVPATTPLDEVLAAMRRYRSQMAVVMDEHGGTAGVVTIGDLFEEVVGEIEEPRGRAPISRDPSGRLVVQGTVRLTDVGAVIGVPLEHPNVLSISGLVLTKLGRPPVVGDTIQWSSVRIEVTAVVGRGVGEAVVSSSVSKSADTSSAP